MKTSTVIWIVVIIIVVVGLGWYFASNNSASQTPTTSVDQTQTPPSDNTTAPAASNTQSSTAPMSATVNLTAQGFSPASVTVANGGTVTFVDQTGQGMYIASDPHPTHQGYDGTTRAQHCAAGATPSFDQCTAGSTYSFTFTKTGSWGYHDHLNPSLKGTVVVQ